ncbi:MAG: cation-translocating P-type ATPase [Leptospira sp.]|nr:cation-translocating P-type ATPase [Leptospira sp.]NCS92763.1 cation-translocating P-type ATPase [Leptospira sp.]
MEGGLSSKEVSEKIKKFGYNELPSSQPKNLFTIAFEVMKEPMFLLLLSCGFLYLILGDYTEGIILLCTIFLIIGTTFYQYRKTERALEAMQKLSSPRVLVQRDERQYKVAGREIVPGDLIFLYEGDRVPADCLLLTASNFTVDESLLTGESIPVQKSIEKDENRIFSGTLVVQGRAEARVEHTGRTAELGKIATSLSELEQQETQLQKEMKVLITRLGILGGFISISIILLFYFSRGNFVQSVLNGLSAAIAILPEEFPVVLTVFLALGSWRLSKKNVLTRKPSAIENLGSATVLCSDKTGTITQNKMQVVVIANNQSKVGREEFSTRLEEINSILESAIFATPFDSIDPMEKAILELKKINNFTYLSPGEVIKQYTMSKEMLAMTMVYPDLSPTSSMLDDSFNLYSKGAPEAILNACNLEASEYDKHMKIVHELAALGYRVLGVASSKMTTKSSELPSLQKDLSFNFQGFLALEDPIRKEVPQAIQDCKRAGVKVVMITGDYPITAKSIGNQIGIQDPTILTGQELDALTEEEFVKKIELIDIFARVVPEQKLRIVNAFTQKGEIVAMTGDGVNDAPALKAAQIGIAMGNKGTDVAREASSLVLLDDNFASIVAAIRQGRKIYDNLQKAMSYIIAIHIPIIGLTLLPAFFSFLPLLLLPLHIVFMELIIDPVCSIAFESEQEEKNIMNRKPRNSKQKFFGFDKISFSVFQGLLLLACVVFVYFLSIEEGHTDGEVRAIAFSSLIIGNIFLILTNLSKTRSFLSVFLEKNYPIYFILFLALLMLILILNVPYLQSVFSFESPGSKHYISAIVSAVVMLAVLEAWKFFSIRLKFAKF